MQVIASVKYAGLVSVLGVDAVHRKESRGIPRRDFASRPDRLLEIQIGLPLPGLTIGNPDLPG